MPEGASVDRVSAVREILSRFTAGFENADGEAVLGTIRRGHETSMFGTDRGEEWFSHTALIEPFRAMAPHLRDSVYRWKGDGPQLVLRGRVAWAVGMLELTMGPAEDRQTVLMRSTFILSEDEDGWAIDHGHFSYGHVDPS